MGEVVATERLDFFVSHAGPDENWAVWLAHQLQDAGYRVELDVWHWSAGLDVIQVTERALDKASRVLAVWTPEYFTRRWASMEHRVSFARAQLEPGWLLPVVVRPCPDEIIPVLYSTLIRIELVGLSEAQARDRLLAAVAGATPGTGRRPYPGEDERGTYPGLLPPIWNVPCRNSFFVGRDSELSELAGRLAAPGAVAAVVGPTAAGGIGKSELVAEFAWRHSSDYRLVWWIDAGHEASADAGLMELAALLGAPTAGGVGAIRPAINAKLRSRTDWLLIVDNAPNRNRLDQLLPELTGRVLVTSHDEHILADGGRIFLGPFSRHESIVLLRRRCSWLNPHSADRIAAVIDDLPVAVAQVAQFLARTGMPADEYLPRLSDEVESALDHQPDSDVGLAAAVAIARECLLEIDPAAADLLDQLALLAPEPVPLTAISEAGDPAAAPGLVVADPETTGELVSSICGLGLAARVRTHVQLHDRVRSLIAKALTRKRRELALGRVLRLLATADPGDPAAHESWPQYADLAPHMFAAMSWLRTTAAIESPEFQRLLDHVCQYLQFTGRSQDSHILVEDAYQRRLRSHGANHPETLRWAVNRGAALVALRRHHDARAALTELLARLQRIAGPDHPDTLLAADCLGAALTALGEFDNARHLLQDALTRRRRQSDTAPQTLHTAAALGKVLCALGYHPQALRIFEEITIDHRRTLGVNHLDTLATAHHLGVVLAAIGDHDAARANLAAVVEARRRVLGADHLDTLESAHALGAVLAAIGDHAAARDILGDTAARRRIALSTDHRSTLESARLHGVALAALGEHDAARRVLQSVVDLRRTTLGVDDPETLTSAHELGVALAALGHTTPARELLDDTVARRRRVLGPNDPETLRTESLLRSF